MTAPAITLPRLAADVVCCPGECRGRAHYRHDGLMAEHHRADGELCSAALPAYVVRPA